MVKNWNAPTTIQGIQSFLGFCNFYHQFIKDYSQIASPLINLPKKDVPFMFDEACWEAFQALKDHLLSAPLLRHYQPDLETHMETDASDGVIAGVLSQKHGDDWHSVAYFLMTMAPAETNYPIHNKEMLAIVQAMEEWRPELVGLQVELPFEVLSNHKALEYFMTTKKLNS